MKVILIGASGMIGKGVLLECLDHTKVDRVLSIGRSPLGLSHPKLIEIQHKDFTDFNGIKDQLLGYNACFFCLGVSSVGMDEADYSHITHDFALAAARILHEVNPQMTFNYVSGQGTDSTEKGRSMWARVKGKTENDILKLGFKQAFMYRPGLILPLRGIQSRTASYQMFYYYLKGLLRLICYLFPNSTTDTTKIGLAMINSHLRGYEKRILDPKDINMLADNK
ncbi:MAG: epimerase [Flavobacteriales bacterium]